MYRVFRRLEKSELVHVASRDQLEQALKSEKHTAKVPRGICSAGFGR